MKRIDTLIVLLVALFACVGCSKDEENHISPEKVDVTFHLSAKSPNAESIGTKADEALIPEEVLTEAEAKIENYFIFVFKKDADGTPTTCEYAVFGENTTGSTVKTTATLLTGEYQVIAFASIPDGETKEALKGIKEGASYETIKSLTVPLTTDNYPKVCKQDWTATKENNNVDIELTQLQVKVKVVMKLDPENKLLTSESLAMTKQEINNYPTTSLLIIPEEGSSYTPTIKNSLNVLADAGYMFQYHLDKAGDKKMSVALKGSFEYKTELKSFDISHQIDQDLLAGHSYTLTGTVKYTPPVYIYIDWVLLDADVKDIISDPFE